VSLLGCPEPKVLRNQGPHQGQHANGSCDDRLRPSISDELFQADADGWLHVFSASRWHDPVIQRIHDLIVSRSR